MSIMLLHQIRRYCERHEMPESNFGREAINDPRLVCDLRKGREPRPQIIEHIHAFMEVAR